MRRRWYLLLLSVPLLVPFGFSAISGAMLGGFALAPPRRLLTPGTVQRADEELRRLGATREDFTVRAHDGVLLRGWKVRPHRLNGEWALLIHGQSDNRFGVMGEALLLLRHGYSLLMMDARAHGESEGAMATYGWLERRDTQAIVDQLYATEKPLNLYALGASMGAAIALQSAAVEPRITGVVAESSFSDLREVSYDYAGLQWNVWLGKTIFLPGSWAAISAGERKGGFSADLVSPEKSVAARPFAVLLICDALDRRIPCRHSERIFRAARGPKELWEVPGAGHVMALGTAPAEFERRVLAFLQRLRPAQPAPAHPVTEKGPALPRSA
jgi:pimeloyl-ACP methyl ester carboxylesterase